MVRVNERGKWRAIGLALLVVLSTVAASGVAGALPAGEDRPDVLVEQDVSTNLGSASIAADWPTQGHDANNSGYNPDATGPSGNVSARWILEVDEDDWYGDTLVVNGTVYVSGERGVRAVDARTGAVLWNTTEFDAEDLTVAGGTLYAAGERNYDWGVFAFDTSDGSELWTDVRGSIEFQTPRVVNGTLFVDYENRLRAYDAETGQYLWMSDDYDDAAPGGIAVSGDTIYLPVRMDEGGTLSGLVALNATDGTERWRFEVDGELAMTPTVANGTVYIGKGDEGKMDDPDPRLYALDPEDGSIEWAYDSHATPHGVAVAEGVVYLSSGNSVRALEEATGEERWTFESEGNDYYGAYTNPPAVADGVVYVTNDRGNVYGLDAASGDQRWWYAVGGMPEAPVVSGDTVYVRVRHSPNTGWRGSRIYALEENPFHFSGLSASTASAAPGESVTVGITLRNNDTETRAYNVSLVDDRPHVGGEVSKGNQSGTLDPGDSVTLSFPTSFNVTGTHDLSVRRELDRESAIGPVAVTVDHAVPDGTWSTKDFDAAGTNVNPHGVGAKERLQEAWNFTADDDNGYVPVTANGTTYIVDEENTDLVAFDEVTGAEQWRYNTTGDDRRIHGSAAATDDLVYLTTFPFSYSGDDVGSNATMYALHASNGTVAWTQKLAIDDGYAGSGDNAPIVADGVVYVAGNLEEDETVSNTHFDARFYALDASTGVIENTYTYGSDDEHEHAHEFAIGEGYAFLQISNDNDVSGGANTEELHAINLLTYSADWIFDDADQSTDVLVGDGFVYVANDTGYREDQRLYAIDISTGTEAWRLDRPTGNYYGSSMDNLALYDGHLYVDQAYSTSSLRHDRLYKLDPATGAEVWNRSIADANNMVIVDGLLYAGDFDFTDTHLYDATTGEYLGTSDLGTMLSVANGTVYTYLDTTSPQGNRFVALRSGARIVISDMQVSADPALVGENVTISATATNVGTLTRSFATSLGVSGSHIDDYYSYNGTYRGTEDTLAPGESTTVSYVVEFRSRGEFTVSIDPFYHGYFGGSPTQHVLDQYLYDEAGNVTIAVGDANDGRTVTLPSRTMAVTADSWPKRGLDANNTGTHGTTTGPTTVDPDVVLWNNTESGYGWTTAPTVADGTVYVGGSDNNRDDHLYAVNATDGSIRWGYASTDELVSAPTYADGFVYFGDSDERLYAVNTTTGRMLWSFHGGDVRGSPTVVDGVVYVGTDHWEDSRVYALNASTRDVLWSFATPDGVRTSPAVANGTVYASTYAGAVYALNATTGAEEWGTTLASGFEATSPVVEGGTVYVGNSDHLYALDAADGSTDWNLTADLSGEEADYPTKPAVADGVVYYGDDDTGTFRAVDATTGAETWNYRLCSPIDGSPAIVDGVVYFGANDGVVYALDSATGDDVWNFRAIHGDPSYPVVYAPAVVDGVAYVATDGDNSPSLYALTGGTSNATADPFSVAGLTVTPTNASVGEAVTISATVSNAGESSCDYTAHLQVDESDVDTTTVPVSGEGSETVSFAYTFDSQGTYNVTIDDLPPVQVTVSGPEPEIDVTPTSYDYADRDVGSPSSEWEGQYFHIENVGQADLDWTSASITGPEAGSFSIASGFEGGEIIAPSSDDWVLVYFIPEEAGALSATLEIASNDTDEGVFEIPLTGTGIAPEPNASVTPTTHDFGDVDVGDTATTNVTVTNDGDSTLTFDGVTHSGNSAFDVTAGNGSTTLAPGESNEFTVSFTPTTGGSVAAILVVLTDDPNDPEVVVTISGSGVQPTEPDVSVSPTSHDFGGVEVGENATTTVTVSSVGSGPLSFDGTSLTGADASVYTVTDGGSTTTIAAGDSHTVTVEFAPTATGLADATLELSTDDADESTVSVALTGNGTITTPNRAPVAAADHYVVTAGATLTVDAPGRLGNDLDPDGDAIIASHHGTPANGTIHTATTSGRFVYEPDPGFTGTDSFVYRVRDDEDAYSSYVPVTIEVLPDPNRAPEAIDDHYSVHAGETLTVSAPGKLVNDRDPDNDSITASHHGNPSHGTLGTSTTAGTFEYEPDPWFIGTDSFVYRIQDEHGEYSSFATITIDVLPPRNRQPTAVADSYSVSQGETLVVDAPGKLANDYDIDGDSIIASHHGNPSHGTLHSSTTAGTFEYEPDPGFTGTDSFVYRVQDEHGEYSSYATVTIEVAADNGEPVAVADHYATLKGQNLTVSGPGRLANDYDLDGDSFIASHHGNPTNGTLHSSTTAGTFEYEPDPGFTGTDSFVYRIQDDRGLYSWYATVTIEVVDPAGTDPVAMPDDYTVYEGESLDVSAPGLLANDVDPNDDAIDVNGFVPSANGSVTVDVDGNFTYTSNPGFTGTDRFTYQIVDANGDLSSYVPVTIEVLPDPNSTPNHPPTAVDDTYSIFQGETLVVDAPGKLANDYDVDNDSLIASHHGDPSHGTLGTSTTAGNFEYVPDPGFTGTDSFVYRIQDEHGEYSSFATVTIEVIQDPNRAPEAIDDHYSVLEGETLTVSTPGKLVNDRDPDGDSIIASHHGNPSHGTLGTSTTAGNFEYEPDPGFTGTDSFVYRVQDEHGEYSSFATITIDVLPDPNREPTAVPDNYAVLQGETLIVDAPGKVANDYDPDNDSLIASHHGDPSHGTLGTSTTAGSFEYVPDPGFTGVDSFIYRIRDEHGEYSGYAPVTITVVEASTSGLADVAVARDRVDFGSVPAGTNVTETITVANVGDRNLTFTGATLSGPNTSAFEVTAGNAPTVLGYGGTTSLTVEYAPTTISAANATLTVLTDDPDEPTVDVALTGTGFDAEAPTVHAIDVTGSSIDTSDPNVTVVYGNESVAVDVNATDEFGTVSDVRITLDSRTSTDEWSEFVSEDGSSGNWTTTIDLATLADGRYDVVVEAYDDGGNRRTVTSASQVVVDQTRPQLAAAVTRINGTAANVTVNANEALRTSSVSVDVERPDGTTRSVSMIDEGGYWNGTFELPQDGQYDLTATAVDRAGNRGSDTATARFVNESTDANNTVTVQMQPSGLFVEFTTDRPVNDTFITMTESNVPVAPLVRGQSGVKFLDAKLGARLDANLSYAVIGIPLDPSLLRPGADADDVTIRYFNDTTRQWSTVPTTVRNVTVNGSTGQYWVATVTHFSTYGAVVSDTMPPTITSMTPADGHEFAAGTTSGTLRVEYDDSLSGVDRSGVVVLLDGTIVNGDATTITDGYAEYEVSGLADGSSHDFEVTVPDEAGNDVTESISFTVASDSSDSGSNDGGDDDGDSGDDTGEDDPTPSPTRTPSPTPTPDGTESPTVTDMSTETATPREPAPTTTTTRTTTPGFTAATALLALLAAIALVVRRRR